MCRSPSRKTALERGVVPRRRSRTGSLLPRPRSASGNPVEPRRSRWPWTPRSRGGDDIFEAGPQRLEIRQVTGGHIVVELGGFRIEAELDGADGPVALLGNDDFAEAVHLLQSLP